ncbi:MAG: helix-turn-helix domain-containing protein [Candidatus Limnocylindria bacterium]
MVGVEAVQRFGHDIRDARRAVGLTQGQLASRTGISQPMISRIERGAYAADLRAMTRLARGVGQQLSVRLYPADGIRLRDSGQLSLAEVIRAAAHSTWRVTLEVPVASPPDRRAADMVLANTNGLLLVEIERGLRDLQAQLRAAQLKRVALSERLGQKVTLMLAMPDSATARQAVAPHTSILRGAMPVTSRAAWAAIRSGSSIDGDALLWVRRR